MRSADAVLWRKQQMQIIGAVSGSITITSDAEVAPVRLTAGQFCLIPAELLAVELVAQPGSRLLRVTSGST
jgi:mannose-6-phosphate isomerase class I